MENFKTKYKLILTIIICIIITVGIAIYHNCKKSNLIEENEHYYTLYQNNKYYVLKNDYNGEYDIQNNEINTSDKTLFNIEKILSFDEYKKYCQTEEINQKYNDTDKKYIVISNINEHNYFLNIRLGDLVINNNNAIVYLWKDKNDRENPHHFMDITNEQYKTYSIIIPINKSIQNLEIRNLCTKLELNMMLKNYPLTNYSYSYEDNLKSAESYKWNYKDENINKLMSKVLKSLIKQKTVKITTKGSTFGTYIDIKNSVCNARGERYSHYTVYTDDGKIGYYSYGEEEDYSYDISYENRNTIFDEYFPFPNNNEIDISFEEDNKFYILTANYRYAGEETNGTIYINKNTNLIDNVNITTSRKTNKYLYNYTSEPIIIPKHCYIDPSVAVCN